MSFNMCLTCPFKRRRRRREPSSLSSLVFCILCLISSATSIKDAPEEEAKSLINGTSTKIDPIQSPQNSTVNASISKGSEFAGTPKKSSEAPPPSPVPTSPSTSSTTTSTPSPPQSKFQEPWSNFEETSQKILRNVGISEKPLVIVISFDGFRYNYFSKTPTPNLDYLKSTGVTVRYMMNQFITKTFPNHHSIATGLYTESHGVMDNWLFDPKYNEILGESNGPVESERLWNYSEEILPAWIVNQANSGSSGVMMWPGGEHYYGPGPKGLLPNKFAHWNTSIAWEWRVDQVVDWIQMGGVNLVYMYFEEPDEVAHGFGPESPQVIEQITRLDNITGYLIEKLRGASLFEQTNLILLSDHGFQEVTAKNMINITEIMKPIGKKDKDYFTYGGTPVIQVRPVDDGKIQAFYDILKKGENHYKVYLKGDLPEHWHFANNRRVMPIVLVAELGWVFDDFQVSIESYNKKYNRTASPNNTYGVHGYDNKYLNMHPFFIGHGPAFVSGVEVADIFENIDVFPLVCHLLQIPHIPSNNGSLARIKRVLKEELNANFARSMRWIVFGLFCIGLAFLSGLLVIVIAKRRGGSHKPLVEEYGYKYINEAHKRPSHNSFVEFEETILEEEEDDEEVLVNNTPKKSKSNTSQESKKNGETNHFILMESPSKPEEYQSLLNASSNEEL